MSRVFVAVWPPETICDALEVIDRPELDGVRWTRRDQWHVTLRFLGETDPHQVAENLAGLDHPVATAVLGTGVGRLGRDALVAPVTGLDDLAAAVDTALGASPRRFLGHLTLARLQQQAACGPARSITAGLRAPLSWRVDRIAVVVSDLLPTGSIYTTVADISLDLHSPRDGCSPAPGHRGVL
jgi:2'-5' RNA ligase